MIERARTHAFLTALILAAAAIAQGQLTLVKSSFSPGRSSDGDGLSLVSTIGSSAGGTSSTGGLTLTSGFLDGAESHGPQLEVLEFRAYAASRGSHPVVTWTTTREPDIEGFRVYRAQGDPLVPAEEISEGLIAPLGTEFSGATYTFSDPEPLHDADRWYFLTSLSLSGDTTFYGPVQAAITGSLTITQWRFY